MRLSRASVLCLLCVLSLLLAGCSMRGANPSAAAASAEQTPEPTSEPTPEPTPEPVFLGGKAFDWSAEELDLAVRTVVPVPMPDHSVPTWEEWLAAREAEEAAGDAPDEAAAEEAAEEPADQTPGAGPASAGVGIEFTAEELTEALRRLPMLRRVDLTGREMSADEQLALRAEFPEVEFAWDVDVFGVTVNSADEYVVLDGIPMEDTAALEKLLPLLPGVRQIDMCKCGLDDETMYELGQRWSDIRFVWIANIGSCPQRTDITSFCMNTVGMPVNATDERLMVQMKYFPDLMALDFGHSGTNIRDVSWLKWLPKLQILILVGCDVRDVTPIAELPELTYLELFTNAYLTDISPLGTMTQLRDLNLSITSVSDLTPLYTCTGLRRLWINGCLKLSTEEVDAFYYAMPECKISFMYNSSGALNGWRQDDRYFWMRDMFDAFYMPVKKEQKYHTTTQYYYPAEVIAEQAGEEQP